MTCAILARLVIIASVILLWLLLTFYLYIIYSDSREDEDRG